jgi:hypothetical protein
VTEILPFGRLCTFVGRGSGGSWKAALSLYWEASLDPISDDFTTEEASALDLLRRWAKKVEKNHPNGLIPVYWFVESVGPDHRDFNAAPFAFDHDLPVGKTFLTSYEWPTDVATGKELNWLQLPVLDKLWRRDRADKGGFIQEATGWKPAAYQPYLFLPALLEATSLRS